MRLDHPEGLAFDVETYFITSTNPVPRLVCASLANPDESRLVLRDEALDLFPRLISDAPRIYGANIAFDFSVIIGQVAREGGDWWHELMGMIFQAYDQGRIHDVQVSQQLDRIAKGTLKSRISLEEAVEEVLGRTDAKVNSEFRIRYGELDGTPIDQWPEEARQYPIDDARNTLEVGIAQRRVNLNQGDLAAQSYAAFCLYLTGLRGLHTDPKAVRELEERLDVAHTTLQDRFRQQGWLREDGTQDTVKVKAAVVRAYGASASCPVCGGTGQVISKKGRDRQAQNPARIEAKKKPYKIRKTDRKKCAACDGTTLDIASPAIPRAEKGGVAKDRDTLTESGDEELMAFGEVSEVSKLRKTYLPFLKLGTSTPITLRPNVLVASGRTSYDGVIQLLPRGGGIRECFVPRPGWVFFSIDYSALELCTLAQCCLDLLGYSRLAEVINEGLDPHSITGAQFVCMEYSQFVKRKKEPLIKGYRQAAKALNFGKPGGMGDPKLVLSKRRRIEGETVAADGTVYSGIRFCILLEGAASCGVEKITEWKGRNVAPVCKRCVELVAYELSPKWQEAYPEMPEYFSYIDRQNKAGTTIKQLRVDRVRGGVGFCDAANTLFQALAADGAKRALCRVVKETYLNRDSPMFGSRVAIFVHDELFGEMPWEAAEELGLPDASMAAPRMTKVMIEAMSELVPDVKVSAEPALMSRWDKSAEAKYVDGRLVPC